MLFSCSSSTVLFKRFRFGCSGVESVFLLIELRSQLVIDFYFSFEILRIVALCLIAIKGDLTWIGLA